MATNPPDVAVIDASVAINLNATGCAAQILTALPFRLLITSIGAAELRDDRRSGRNDGALLAALVLVKASLIRPVPLGTRGNEVFASLVIGPAAETLDDGEAATIAYAVEHDIPPVIDERKAVRICAQRFPESRVLSTVDLLMDPAVLGSLGRESLANAVFLALTTARMRVLPGWVEPVVRLIGPERATQCSSLPASARRP